LRAGGGAGARSAAAAASPAGSGGAPCPRTMPVGRDGLQHASRAQHEEPHLLKIVLPAGLEGEARGEAAAGAPALVPGADEREPDALAELAERPRLPDEVAPDLLLRLELGFGELRGVGHAGLLAGLESGHGFAAARQAGPSGLGAIAKSRGVGRQRTRSIFYLGALRRPRGRVRESLRPSPEAASGSLRHGRRLENPSLPLLSAERGVKAPEPGLARAYGPPRPDASGSFWPDPLPVRSHSPAVVQGGRISDGGGPRYAGAAESARASRAGGRVTPGRRRRPRPTSRRLMSAPLGWTGPAQASTNQERCQGLFS
jgi:hypothetical protein